MLLCLRLFKCMGSRSTVNVKCISHLLSKTKPSKHIWFDKFDFSSLNALEDDNFVLAESGSISDFSETRKQDDVSREGKDTVADRSEKAHGIEIKAVENILAKHGWIQDSLSEFTNDLNQFQIIKILNDLYEESQDASISLYFFRWSECCRGSWHSLRCVCRMINILVSGNMNYRAVDLFLRLVNSYSEEVSSCDLLLEALYETHTDHWALKTILSMLVHCCITEGKLDMAIRLTCQMEHLEMFPSIRVCNSLLKALLSLHKVELAWDFLEHMLNRGMSLNSSIISLFIDRYCTDGNFQKAWKLLMEMKNHGIRLDVVAYSIVIHKLCKASWLKEATSLVFKITQLGVIVDSVLVSSVVDGYCKAGKPEEAIMIMKYLRLKPNIFVYNSFLSILCRKGDMLKASLIFQEIAEADIHLDTVCYTTFIRGFCRAGELDKAFQQFALLLKSGNPPSVTTYTVLIDACCKSRNVGEAEALFRNMINDGLQPDVVAYNSLMNGYGKKGFFNKVFELLGMMKAAGVSPDVASYNILIHSLVLGGYVDVAKGIIDELPKRGLMPDVVSFTNIIDGFSKKANFKEAFLHWFRMSDLQVKPDAVICSALLNGYCKTRRMDEANSLFCKMLDAGLEPDLILYNTLIRGFCSISDIDRASELVEMMVQKGIFPNEVTHHALAFGFEKKRVKDPLTRASMRIEEILRRYGVCHATD